MNSFVIFKFYEFVEKIQPYLTTFHGKKLKGQVISHVNYDQMRCLYVKNASQYVCSRTKKSIFYLSLNLSWNHPSPMHCLAFC